MQAAVSTAVIAAVGDGHPEVAEAVSRAVEEAVLVAVGDHTVSSGVASLPRQTGADDLHVDCTGTGDTATKGAVMNDSVALMIGNRRSSEDRVDDAEFLFARARREAVEKRNERDEADRAAWARERALVEIKLNDQLEEQARQIELLTHAASELEAAHVSHESVEKAERAALIEHHEASQHAFEEKMVAHEQALLRDLRTSKASAIAAGVESEAHDLEHAQEHAAFVAAAAQQRVELDEEHAEARASFEKKSRSRALAGKMRAASLRAARVAEHKNLESEAEAARAMAVEFASAESLVADLRHQLVATADAAAVVHLAAKARARTVDDRETRELRNALAAVQEQHASTEKALREQRARSARERAKHNLHTTKVKMRLLEREAVRNAKQHALTAAALAASHAQSCASVASYYCTNVLGAARLELVEEASSAHIALQQRTLRAEHDEELRELHARVDAERRRCGAIEASGARRGEQLSDEARAAVAAMKAELHIASAEQRDVLRATRAASEKQLDAARERWAQQNEVKVRWLEASVAEEQRKCALLSQQLGAARHGENDGGGAREGGGVSVKVEDDFRAELRVAQAELDRVRLEVDEERAAVVAAKALQRDLVRSATVEAEDLARRRDLEKAALVIQLEQARESARRGADEWELLTDSAARANAHDSLSAQQIHDLRDALVSVSAALEYKEREVEGLEAELNGGGRR